MSREQQNEPVQGEAATNVEAKPVLSAEEEKQKNAEQYQKSMTEGKKYALEHKFEEASDLFSDAAHFAKLLYGEGPESFDAFFNYGESLVSHANQLFQIMRNLDDEESSEDSESEEEEEATEQQTEATEPSKEGDKADAEMVDQSEQATAEKPDLNQTVDFDAQVSDEEDDDEPSDPLEEILADASGVFEIAKKICDNVLQNSANDEAIKKLWDYRLKDVHDLFGQVMLLSDQPQLAKEEFNKALTILKKYLPEEDRQIASIYFDLGKAYELECEYDDAKTFYGKALKSLEGVAAQAKSEEDATLLKALCTDIQEKLKEVDETAALAKEFINQTSSIVKKALPTIDKAAVDAAVDASAGDDVVRKRTRESDAAESTDFKKSKIN